MCLGREFQRERAAAEKALSPKSMICAMIYDAEYHTID